jgi:hypothetical protein
MKLVKPIVSDMLPYTAQQPHTQIKGGKRVRSSQVDIGRAPPSDENKADSGLNRHLSGSHPDKPLVMPIVSDKLPVMLHDNKP